MTRAIDTVFIDAILVPLLRELGLPETLPLAKLSPRVQKWVLGEAACLQRDAMSHSTFALLVEYGYPFALLGSCVRFAPAEIFKFED